MDWRWRLFNVRLLIRGFGPIAVHASALRDFLSLDDSDSFEVERHETSIKLKGSKSSIVLQSRDVDEDARLMGASDGESVADFTITKEQFVNARLAATSVNPAVSFARACVVVSAGEKEHEFRMMSVDDFTNTRVRIPTSAQNTPKITADVLVSAESIMLGIAAAAAHNADRLHIRVQQVKVSEEDIRLVTFIDVKVGGSVVTSIEAGTEPFEQLGISIAMLEEKLGSPEGQEVLFSDSARTEITRVLTQMKKFSNSPYIKVDILPVGLRLQNNIASELQTHCQCIVPIPEGTIKGEGQFNVMMQYLAKAVSLGLSIMKVYASSSVNEDTAKRNRIECSSFPIPTTLPSLRAWHRRRKWSRRQKASRKTSPLRKVTMKKERCSSE